MTEEPKKETKIVRISQPLSMELWSLLAYFKGRKEGVLALLGTAIALIIQDSGLVAVFSGLVFESIISVTEFYFRKIEVKQ